MREILCGIKNLSLEAAESSLLSMYGNTFIRAAVRRNVVSFPAQIPAFLKLPTGSLQQSVAQVYFVHGWSMGSICGRYGLGKQRVLDLLSNWHVKATSAGLIKEIQALDLNHNQTGEHLSGAGRTHDFYPAVHATQDNVPRGDGALMMVLMEDCAEFGISLSTDQLRRIERIVRNVSPPGRLAETTGVSRPMEGAGVTFTSYRHRSRKGVRS